MVVAAQRAKQIASGSPITIPRDKDKDTVVSLREIAEGTASHEKLKDEITLAFQKRGKQESIDESEPMSPMLAEARDELKSLENDDEFEDGADSFQVQEGEDLDFSDEETDAE